MDFAPIIFISAVTGQRAPKIFELIDKVYDQYTKRIGTSPLNDLVEKSVRKNPMARYANRQMHISYATQTDVNHHFSSSLSATSKVSHFSYERYLTNQIRETFGFDSVPLKLVFRKKRYLSVVSRLVDTFSKHFFLLYVPSICLTDQIDIDHHLSAFLNNLRKGGRNDQYRECSTEDGFIFRKFYITRC